VIVKHRTLRLPHPAGPSQLRIAADGRVRSAA